MKLILATDNPGKLRELRALLSDYGVQVIPQAQFGLQTPAEGGATFTENALLKARYAAAHTGEAALADDSGLEVDALEGRPGVYSARYAGKDASDESNNRKLLAELREVPWDKRTARYRCVLALVRETAPESALIYEGVWEGRIGLQPQGDGGFGYDPVFVVHASGTTAAQLPPEVKNAVSHRGQALRKLATFFAGN